MKKNIKFEYNPGFMWFLTLIFVILKTTGHIAWSWWWVFSPLWLPFLIGMFTVLILSLWGWSYLMWKTDNKRG